MFRARLRRGLSGFDMVKEVRGMGLLNGIEFVPPRKLAFRALYQAFHHIHPAMFGQIVVMRMFREKGILTQICGNNFMVLKAAPPLTVTPEQLDEFVSAIRAVVELAESSPASGPRHWLWPAGQSTFKPFLRRFFCQQAVQAEKTGGRNLH